MAVLDSKAGAFMKPPANASMMKMWSLLQRVDENLDISLWTFVTNKPGDIPQQGNSYNCGVFLCLYARWLVNKGVMIEQRDIPEFRKFMILELHKNSLHSILPEIITVVGYYAVDYVNQSYIGRTLANTSHFTRFKFLHRIGDKHFDWPRRDDIDEVHATCVFYGPLRLQGNGPFDISNLEELETVFQAYKKQSSH